MVARWVLTIGMTCVVMAPLLWAAPTSLSVFWAAPQEPGPVHPTATETAPAQKPGLHSDGESIPSVPVPASSPVSRPSSPSSGAVSAHAPAESLPPPEPQALQLPESQALLPPAPPQRSETVIEKQAPVTKKKRGAAERMTRTAPRLSQPRVKPPERQVIDVYEPGGARVVIICANLTLSQKRAAGCL